jgi:hypothetical protein
MFQLTDFTEATLKTLTNRVEKHGDDDKPAVSLGMEITCSNAVLDLIDPKLRTTFYKRKDDQPDLPEVEQVLPVLQCHSVESVKLPTKHEGWTLQVDDGIDDTKPLTFGQCKVDKFSFEPKQGGSIVLKLRVGTSDLDAARSGMLGMHVGQSIWITLKAPEKLADAIDGSTEAFNKDHPDAGALFAEEHGDGLDSGGTGADDSDSEGGEADITGSDGPWPFPKDAAGDAPPQSVTVETSRPGTRTARGRDKTKAALAAGVSS